MALIRLDGDLLENIEDSTFYVKVVCSDTVFAVYKNPNGAFAVLRLNQSNKVCGNCKKFITTLVPCNQSHNTPKNIIDIVLHTVKWFENNVDIPTSNLNYAAEKDGMDNASQNTYKVDWCELNTHQKWWIYSTAVKPDGIANYVAGINSSNNSSASNTSEVDDVDIKMSMEEEVNDQQFTTTETMTEAEYNMGMSIMTCGTAVDGLSEAARGTTEDCQQMNSELSAFVEQVVAHSAVNHSSAEFNLRIATHNFGEYAVDVSHAANHIRTTTSTTRQSVHDSINTLNKVFFEQCNIGPKPSKAETEKQFKMYAKQYNERFSKKSGVDVDKVNKFIRTNHT